MKMYYIYESSFRKRSLLKVVEVLLCIQGLSKSMLKLSMLLGLCAINHSIKKKESSTMAEGRIKFMKALWEEDLFSRKFIALVGI